MTGLTRRPRHWWWDLTAVYAAACPGCPHTVAAHSPLATVNRMRYHQHVVHLGATPWLS